MDNKLIARVRKMEEDFNMVRNIMDDMEVAVYNFAAVQRRIDRLFDYMEDGQFLEDFEADERGELPKDMPRGVLSEDALDSLLVDVTLMRSRLQKLVGEVSANGEEEPLGFEEYDPMYNSPDEIPEDCGSYIVVLREDGEGLPFIPFEPEEFEGQDVIYVGDAENLRKITDILKGNSAKSFLRLNIGAMKYLDSVESKDGIRFSVEDERSLSRWMKENILFYYQTNPLHAEVTKRLIDELDPVLNLEHESPVWKDFRRRLAVFRDTCIVDEDYKKVNTKKSVIKTSGEEKELEASIRKALEENASRIPEKYGVGTVASMISYANRSEDEAISMIFGSVNDYGEKEQSITVWYFDFNGQKQIKEFLASPEGKNFGGDPEDEDFEFRTKARDPKLAELLLSVLKKHIGLSDKAKLIIRTTATPYGR